MPRIEKYEMRLDNSICDVVAIRSPNGIFEIDGVTPKDPTWWKPFRYSVLLAHLNPNDDTNRRVYIYRDDSRDFDHLSDHELFVSDFKMTPKIFHDECVQNNYKKRIAVTSLSNLKYVFPNIVKRTKILLDGATFCRVKDLSTLKVSDTVKAKLKDYDNAADPDTIPDLTTIGKVIKLHPFDLIPLEVQFPNGYNGRFYTDDLMYFHEIED